MLRTQPVLLIPPRWEDAIRVAEGARHPDAEGLKQRHYKWLLETGQEEMAGLVKEREGDFLGAISLYLKGGLPARAAQVLRGGGKGRGGLHKLQLGQKDQNNIKSSVALLMAYRTPTPLPPISHLPFSPPPSPPLPPSRL